MNERAPVGRKSIRVRMVVALLGNGLRASMSFVTGILVARSLGSAQFGNYSYLVSTFGALRPLLDLGMAAAFFTYISRGESLRRHLPPYLSWLTLQFLLVVAGVVILLPTGVFSLIWPDYSRSLVLLSFLASFLSMQGWSTVTQVGESRRETATVQGIAASVAAVHLSLMGYLASADRLSVPVVFWCTLGEYTAAISVGVILLRRRTVNSPLPGLSEPPKPLLADYWNYCRPLALATVAGGVFEFGDRWLLQRFGGAENQGVYQAAFQFAAICLFATTSILQVLWKEFAAAFARGDLDTARRVYSKVSHALTWLGAASAGLLVPWAEEIARFALGGAFAGSSSVMALLFLYPVHQALGQVTTTVALAMGATGLYSRVVCGTTVASLALSYLLQAPAGQVPIGGLGMGAMGLAVKVVAFNVVSVNLLMWVVVRRLRWPYEWRHQVLSIVASVGFGYAAKALAGLVLETPDDRLESVWLPALLAACVYCIAQTVLLWRKPAMAGLERDQLIRCWTWLISHGPNTTTRT